MLKFIDVYTFIIHNAYCYHLKQKGFAAMMYNTRINTAKSVPSLGSLILAILKNDSFQVFIAMVVIGASIAVCVIQHLDAMPM